MTAKRIGILTGGGDVPGLNSVIKGVVCRSSGMGWEVVGLRRGWEGLTHLNLADAASRERYVRPLTPENTRTIDRAGGTALHTSRTNPSRMKSLPPHLSSAEFPAIEVDVKGAKTKVHDVSPAVLRNLEGLRLDYLIAIGGDDTLSYAARLNDLGVKVVAVPKTMDNDVRNTEYCIGFSTAITRATDAIQRLRTTVGSHERIGVCRIFGRDAGFTSLYTAYVASIHCAIPEYKFDLPTMIELLVKDKRNNPSSYSLVLLSEGATWQGYAMRETGPVDAYGHARKVNVGEAFGAELSKVSKEESIICDLTYELRSGAPDFMDKLVATTFGNMAMDSILRNETGLMTGIVGGCYAMVPIPDPKLGPRVIDVASMYDTKNYRPRYEGKTGLPVFLSPA